MEQRTKEWFEARKGKVTASNLRKILKNGTERENYKKQIVKELLGHEVETFTNKAMEWGTTNEPRALAAYEMASFNKVQQVGFVLHRDIKHFGASPDGLVNENGTIEIKCPFNSENHLETIMNGMSDYHMPQVQGVMLATGREWCDFVSFDPRQPLGMDIYIERIKRNENYIKMLESKIQSFWVEILEEISL